MQKKKGEKKRHHCLVANLQRANITFKLKRAYVNREVANWSHIRREEGTTLKDNKSWWNKLNPMDSRKKQSWYVLRMKIDSL